MLFAPPCCRPKGNLSHYVGSAWKVSMAVIYEFNWSKEGRKERKLLLNLMLLHFVTRWRPQFSKEDWVRSSLFPVSLSFFLFQFTWSPFPKLYWAVNLYLETFKRATICSKLWNSSSEILWANVAFIIYFLHSQSSFFGVYHLKRLQLLTLRA